MQARILTATALLLLAMLLVGYAAADGASDGNDPALSLRDLVHRHRQLAAEVDDLKQRIATLEAAMRDVTLESGVRNQAGEARKAPSSFEFASALEVIALLPDDIVPRADQAWTGKHADDATRWLQHNAVGKPLTAKGTVVRREQLDGKVLLRIDLQPRYTASHGEECRVNAFLPEDQLGRFKYVDRNQEITITGNIQDAEVGVGQSGGLGTTMRTLATFSFTITPEPNEDNPKKTKVKKPRPDSSQEN